MKMGYRSFQAKKGGKVGEVKQVLEEEIGEARASFALGVRVRGREVS